MSALPPEFVAVLRSPSFAERVSAGVRDAMTENFSNIPGSESYVAPTGVWAVAKFDNGEWWLDLSRDNRVLGPLFVAVFPLFFGGFFWLVGGRAAGLTVGVLALICAGVYWGAMIREPAVKRPVAIRGDRWVWNDRDEDLRRFIGLIVVGLSHRHAVYRCLVGIAADGEPTLLTQYAGSPLIRLVQQAGYPVADGRFGFETPSAWAEWA